MVGRLLITLYLVSSGILEKPLLYLSEFFEKNKTLYYDNLNFVRTKNDLTQWINFFLIRSASLFIFQAGCQGQRCPDSNRPFPQSI